MKSFNPDRWAILGPKDNTGLGRMGADMVETLGIRNRLVPNNRPLEGPLEPNTERLIDVGCSLSQLKLNLDGLQGIIAFERFFHPQMLRATRELEIKTICVPMWEWFRGCSPSWRDCDYFICPNHICLALVRSYGFNNSVYAPWVLDISRFPCRVIDGPGKHFVHNAGEIDPDDRKGTQDAIAAFRRVDLPNVDLTVRTQRVQVDSRGDPRIKVSVGTLPDPAALYALGDVFVQPSKLEGIGFMILEAVVSGLPVISVNNAPMNQWVVQRALLANPSRLYYPSYSSSWIEHAHLRPPNKSSLTKCILWAATHNLKEISVRNREWAERTFARAHLTELWGAIFDKVIQLPPQRANEFQPEPSFPCLTVPHLVRQHVRGRTGAKLPFFRSPVPKLGQ